MKSLIKSKRKY